MKRDYLIFVVTLLLCIGSSITTIDALDQRNYRLRGYVDPTQDMNLPFRVPLLGVNADLTQYDSKKLERSLQLMDVAHITWVRQMVRWNEIEPVKGQLNWDKLDTVLAALRTHPNLKPVVVLVSAPTWAKTLSPELTAPPLNTELYASFAGAFAKRYANQIDYYQIWDEPNLNAAWGGKDPNPAAYTNLLAAAYKAIRGNDPSATVIAAALAPTIETGPQNISDILYLRTMYAVGAKEYMDAVAGKPYGFDASPDDRTISPDRLNFSHIIALREEMVRNGDSKKAIWASEWGWNSLPIDWKGRRSIWGKVSTQQQINYTVSALARANREWPWMAGMTISQWQPMADSDNPTWGFALLDQNDHNAPLLNALLAIPTSSRAQNGLFPALNPNTRYSGVWTFGSLGADIGWVQDSQFDFDFSGSAVSMLLRQDNYTAYLYPTIDNEQADATPIDASGNSYIVLTSPSLQPETNLVAIANKLSQSDHTLHVVADRGWDRWAIAGFAVSSGDLSSPYNNQIVFGWLTALITGLGAIISGRRFAWKTIERIGHMIALHLGVGMQLILSIISSIALLIGMLLTWRESGPNVLRHEPIPLAIAIITSGLIKLQPGFVLTLIASLALLAVFFNFPHIGLTLTIFWSPFFLFPVELYRFAFPMAELMIILTSIAWLLKITSEYAHWRQAVNQQYRLIRVSYWVSKTTIFDRLLFLWVLLAAASLLWAERRAAATTELRVIFIEPILFYVIFRTSRLKSNQVLFVLHGFLLAGTVVALVGLVQYVQGESIITAEAGAKRLASVYGSPNNVALYLGRCIPFVIAFGILHPRKWTRIGYFIMLIPIGIALLLTQSVGGIFIGVPLSIVIVLALILGRRGRYVLLMFVLVLIIGFFFSLQSERFARVLDFSSGTNFYRVRAWLSAINIIRDHPITGLGLDQFLYQFRGRYILPDAWQEPNLSHPHNILLDFWVRLGILGALLLIAIQYMFWRKAFTLYKLLKPRNPIQYAILIGIIGSMVNLIGHGLIDNSVFVQDLSYVFVLLIALIQTHERAIY